MVEHVLLLRDSVRLKIKSLAGSPFARAVVGVLCLLLLASCHSRRVDRTPAAIRLPGDSAVLPVTWWCDFALVEATINGGEPMTFLLDTGAMQTVIDEQSTAKCNTRLINLKQSLRASDGAVVAVRKGLHIEELRAGDVRFRDFDASVLDLDDIADALGCPLDGVLPISLFRGCLLAFDSPRREVRIERGTLTEVKGPGVFKVKGDNRPHVPLKVNGRIHPCLLDTGASDELTVPRSLFAGLEFTDPPVAASTTVGAGGKQAVTHTGRFDGTVDFAGTAIEHPILVETAGGTRAGMALLRQFAITCDPAAGLVRIVHTGEEPVTARPLRSLGVTFRSNRAPWRVWDILPFSQASEKGLQPGDPVTAINGIPVEKLEPCELRDLYRREPSITLEVGGAEPREIRLEVVEVVH